MSSDWAPGAVRTEIDLRSDDGRGVNEPLVPAEAAGISSGERSLIETVAFGEESYTEWDDPESALRAFRSWAGVAMSR